MNHNFKYIFLAILLSTFLLTPSCKKFVEVGAPTTQVGLDEAFSSNAGAVSVISGLYSRSNWQGNAYSPGIFLALSGFAGLSSDELKMASYSSPYYSEMKNNVISTGSPLMSNFLWAMPYNNIAQCNFALDGLTKSTSLTPVLKDQLMGEVLFLRSFLYFYLVNLYGDVPLVLSNDPNVSNTLPRTSSKEIYSKIIEDLKIAQKLMGESYPDANRSRANRLCATALLARTYLYTGDFANAEAEASRVISASTAYQLSGLPEAFLSASKETILQFSSQTGISAFGSAFIAAPGFAPQYVLEDNLYSSFAPADMRKAVWSGEVSVGTRKYYTINKYRQRSGVGDEYSVVLRLAEQYLIRAEARTELSKLPLAIADLDAIRQRAGLLPLLQVNPSISKSNLLLEVESERKWELFGEFGHRWLDLKRRASINTTGQTRADDVLGAAKPQTWKSSAQLYPIPQSELKNNPNLIQNPGYAN
jgi:hypothetical protein